MNQNDVKAGEQCGCYKSPNVPPVGQPPRSKVGLGGDKPVPPPVSRRPMSKIGLGDK